MMMRIAYRFILPAVLLLATLVWFDDHLRLLPTRERVVEYVKQLSVTTGGSSHSSNGTQVATNSTKTTTTEAILNTPTEATSPVKDVIDAIIADSRDKIIVMGALNREDTTWVADKLPE